MYWMLISESIINFTTIVRSISTLKSFKHNEMNVALSKSKIEEAFERIDRYMFNK